jgi:hypothetical protein
MGVSMNKHLHFTNGEIIKSSITFSKQKYKYSPIISSGCVYCIMDGLVDKLEYGAKRHFKEME